MDNLKIYWHPAYRQQLPSFYNEENFRKVRAFHESMPEYAPTPLVSLNNLAKALGVKAVFVKDESKRFGLNAFKALGATYALGVLLNQHPEIREVVTATDGNHGRGVAWAAHRTGRHATVFMPRGTASARLENIRRIGASHAEILDKVYDDCVRHAAAFARENGAALVQDTAFEGYHEIPRNIVLGYSTMAAEAADALDSQNLTPTHVFLQAGVGSMAGGVAAYLAWRYGDYAPMFATLEAFNTPCIYESLMKGRPASACYSDYTAMAGLNCGEANPDILPVLNEYVEYCIQCPDEATYEGMRRLAHPMPGDESIVSGESGAIGIGVLTRLMLDPALDMWKQRMCLNEDSVVLLFSTEGDTDPENYRRVVENNA